ncbi:MAG: ThuA domain-containing protein [Bacteroidota bacterium]
MHYNLRKYIHLALLLNLALIGSYLNLGAQCVGAFKVLHYTETSGVDYNTKAQSLALFQSIGSTYNFIVVEDSTGVEFNTLANLETYAVVIFSNTSGDAILTPAQRANFEAYINGGGSYMGIHSAAETYRHSSALASGVGVWDWFAETVNGVSAQESPKATSPTKTDVLTQEPIAQAYFIGIPNPWTKTDEYYYWENGYQNTAFLEVLTVDSTGTQSYDVSRMAAHVSDLATGGRAFYTSLGASPTDFSSDADFQNFMRNAVLWTSAPNIDITIGTGLTVTGVVTDASCDMDDGAIDITTTGGSGTYTYNWSNGINTEDITGLAPGEYGVLANDGQGCYGLLVFDVDNGPFPIVEIDTLQEIDCNGIADGSLIANVSGGGAPFTYAWNSGPTTATITGLGPATYEVIVTNDAGCKDTAQATLSEPAALTLGITQTQFIQCFGDITGGLLGTAGGGVPPYSYSWSSGQATAAVNGLAAGKYVLTVTDANLCIIKDSLTITQPTDISISLTETQSISCFGLADGEITSAVTGGTGPYTYAWSNGGTTAIINGLDTGKYVLTLTDTNGCIAKDSLSLTQPDSLSATASIISQISCFGATDGAGQVVVTGGTAPYTYAWSSGSTAATTNNLGAGTYLIDITDANGCTAKDSITLVDPSLLTVSLSETNSIDCFGDADAEITATPTGGTPPYTYSWDNGANMSVISPLDTGKYVLTLTDANNCLVTDSLTISQPDSLTVTASVQTIISCFGANDGAVTSAVSGGTAPYTYSWTGGATTATSTNLGLGTYVINITDANGCTAIDSVVLTEPTALTTTLSESQAIDCFGAATGEITAVVGGGTAPYTYAWDNGQSTAIASNLDAGKYVLTVTDANGCIKKDSLTLIQPTELIVSLSITNNISCFGGNDGELTASVSGGTMAYTYSWDNGQTTAVASNLSAGKHVLTVTDANGCVKKDSVDLGQPTQLVPQVSVTNQISCFGANDGSALAGATGGTAPYSYAWNTGETTAAITNLAPGTYIATVTDANGCSEIDSVTLSEPTQLAVALTLSEEISCFGEMDGEIVANGTGGTLPYTYSWDNGTSGSINGSLGIGQYVLTLTDANGCVVKDSLTLTQPDTLIATASVATIISCFGANDGAVQAAVMGGTGPYTYLWNNGPTTAINPNLGTGTYIVTVNDDRGCVDVDTVVLTEPALLTLSLTETQSIDCFGLTNGAISSTVGGGTAPYTYAWDNGSTMADINGLAAGKYVLTVTDANGCTIQDSLELVQPDSLIATASVINQVSCFGAADGSAGIAQSGGTAPYTYVWSNGQTTATATALSPGTYTVTITDANGCTDTSSVLITQPPLLQLNLVEAIEISCFGEMDGAISAFVSGGTPFYSYAWDDGQINQTAVNLGSGWHYVTATDQNGCTIRDSLFLDEPAPLVGSIAELNSILCYGDNTGLLQASATGGNPPYDYLWNTGSPNAIVNNLAAGQYSVIITDIKSCVDTVTFDLQQPDSIVINTTITQTISCNGASDGAIGSLVTGGTAPYSYLWSNGDTTSDLTNISAGSYGLLVTDANGCTGVTLVSISEPAPLAINFNNIENVSCFGGADGEATAVVSGGTAPYTYAWSNGQTTMTAMNLAAGTYMVVVTDSHLCVDSATVTITEPTALTATLGVNQIINCNGGNNGSITATPTGGTAPYTYLWSNGQTTQTAINLMAGTYTVTITDSLNCTYVDSLNISEPTAVTSSLIELSPISCQGQTDGSLQIVADGGTAPYSYLWNTGWTGNVITGLGEGFYSATVTDSLGCTSTSDTMFVAPQALQIDIVVLDSIDCFQAKTASLTVNVTGGTPAYIFDWFDGSTTQDRSGLGAGTYKLTVIDARGCSQADSVVIVSPPELTSTTNLLSDALCFGSSDGQAEIIPAGGTPPYSYLWSNGDTTAITDSLPAGRHYVTLTDDRNCVLMDSVDVGEPAILSSVMAVVNPISCAMGADGQLSVTPSGGTAPYTYLWSDGQTDSIAINLAADTLSVVITDANGCMLSDTLILTDPDPLSLQIAQTQSANCGLANNGEAQATVGGGVGPYTYQWDNGQTTALLQNVIPGQYVLTVTDSLGCTITDSVTITEEVPWTATISIVDSVTCFDSNDGSATVELDVPSTGFSFNWSNGQSTQTATDLGPEMYIVKVLDQYGCDTTLSIQMNQPDSIEIFASIILATPGESNGSIKVDSLRNGTAPFDFFWSSGDTDSLANMLAQGTYFLNLVDAKGCEQRQEFQVDTTTFAWENFEARPDFNLYQIQLVWSSLREVGNENYTVERSIDRLAFTPILEQASGGDSFSPQSYEDWDENPIEGRSFYRIKQTSFNGFFTYYSQIREVFFGNEEPGYVLVFPVPVIMGENLRVEFEMKNIKSTEILLRNAAHQEVYNMVVPLPDGRQSFEISTEGLSPGHYYIMVTNGDEAYSAQLIIEDN